MKMRLLSKMLLYILTPAIAGLLLLAGVSYQMSEDILRDQIRNDARSLLRCQTIGLHAMLQVMEEALSMVAADNRVKLYLDSVNDKMPEVMTRTMYADADAALDSFVSLNSNFAFCGVAGLDGKAIAHHVAGEKHPSKSVGVSFTDRDYFQRGMQGKKTIVGVISKTTGKITTVMGLPILRDGKPAGIVWAGIDNENMASKTTSQIDFGSRGSIYAYDSHGKVMLHRAPKAYGRDDSSKPYMAEILKNPEGRVRFVAADGREKTIYYQAMPAEGWVLCLEFDREEIFNPINVMLSNSMLLTLVSTLAVGLIIFFAARAIARMLKGISGMAEAVAQGRLEASASEKALLLRAAKRRDEFSTLALGMENMIDNIKRLLQESAQKARDAQQATEQAKLATARAEEAAQKAENAKREGMLAAAGQLEEVVEIISAASNQLTGRIEQSDHIAAQSAQRLSEAATAMNEMNATVQEVARNASSASAVSAETRTNAESGANIVENALKSIGQVQKVSLALKDDMTKLNQHAQAITQIMNVISDIADQTNLLALNAAIEAARAGEAGRGFAVVADEVRKLAEKTMASTNDVGNAIGAIQQSASQSVAAMDKALEEVNTATDFASQSGAALRGIVRNVEATADQVSAIATASEEQSAASEEINQSIVEVNDMSGQTAQAMGEASKAVADLAQQARRLSELIEAMKRS
ncbi:methyl-accepting chemotaxis protein [Desulfovibrio desulfuricans]|uniref:Methyl-accepting chemotaxis protein n=1 Tax=Desulfovibrio desulfuricans TaxID=876 RepID=A0A4P7UMR5_DESDE|nr:methyl-accepting chemotaxis protein [Desulfovibrio desulfuricans]QCC86278.1 methyl-accepting chemotaxis protein [Desulfovibrio desulfuricans]